MGKLSARRVDTIKEPGRYGDGDGLYLHVGPGGAKSWVLRVRVPGATTKSGTPLRKEIGLGAVSLISLAEARQKAASLRAIGKSGRDPAPERDRKALTFEDAAERLLERLSVKHRSAKHSALWLSSLKLHVFPHIGSRPIEEIERHHVVTVLSPLWFAKRDTARRLKQRIGAVFSYAIGTGDYHRPNPVDEALVKALGHQGASDVAHHAALPWHELPAFYDELVEREAMAAQCLRWIILTGVRSNEARGARWDEIDRAGKVWHVPAGRMKGGKSHRVPITDAGLAVLDAVEGLDADLIFPGPTTTQAGKARPLSINCFRPLFARMGRSGITVHGFRSSFRDWCSDYAKAPREVAEASLAHQVQGVEGAYARSDLLERRRELMAAWGRYVTEKSGEVIELVRA